MRELERVEQELEHIGDDKWTSQKLWVHNRRVVFEEPESLRKREIASKQFVAEIALEVVTMDARQEIRKLNRRNGALWGGSSAGSMSILLSLFSQAPAFLFGPWRTTSGRDTRKLQSSTSFPTLSRETSRR